MKIESVFISNFKSYNQNGVEISFSEITGFIGKNSAGKSNVLEALDIFFHPVKLDASAFHKRQTDAPIYIDVTFSNSSPINSLEEKVLMNEGKITLRRIFRWKEEKRQAEADKGLFPGAIWLFYGENSGFNPLPTQKLSAQEIKSFLSSPESNLFRKQTGIEKTANATTFYEALAEYWKREEYTSSEWKSNYQWQPRINIMTQTQNKTVIEFANTIVLPDYIYIPVEHSVSDEMSFKKGSRLENLFSSLFTLTETEQTRQKKAIDKIQEQIEKYFSNFYSKKLTAVNNDLNSCAVQWNFSSATLKIQRKTQGLDTILQPSWTLTADDGFLSEIGEKGNGLQRLAILQLLQMYVDIKYKSAVSNDVILAIEEPELYLHPPYKRALYRLFRKLVGMFQVIYTTHDPTFVQVEYFDEIRLVRKNDAQESCIASVNWSLFENGDIWKRVFRGKKTKEARRQELQNKCHGEQNEGFFADKVILVEGATEAYALPVYFEKAGLDLDRENISLIPAQGVDSLNTMYAIFSAFGIPTYVIFDGDKPKENHFELYQSIQKCGKEEYIGFIEALSAYLKDCSGDNLKQVRKKKRSVSSILPSELVDQLNNETPDVSRLESLYHSELMSAEILKDYYNKEQRDCRLQRMLGSTSVQGFGLTTIQARFTMWEFDFEESISKGLRNYEELNRQASQVCSGKPLIAKMIANKSSVKDWSPELKDIFHKIVANLRALTSAENLLKPTPAPETRKSSILFKLASEPSECSLKVFLCAGGPLNPFADEPIGFAEGEFPINTSYIVKISGDSMEPDIPDGSYVAVEKVEEEPPDNQYCIFCLNGNSICKQYRKGEDGKIRLISRKKTCPSIEVHEGDRLDCYGTVICQKNKKPYLLQIE